MLQAFRNSRDNLRQLLESKGMQIAVAVLLLISAITISWEITIRYQTTSEAQKITSYLAEINNIILYVFAAEILIRMLAYGRHYLKSAWNIFDFIVVGLSLLTLGGFFQIIRTFRLFLFLRSFSIFPRLQHLVTALGHAIPKIFSTAALLLLAIYIFAVWGVIEYAQSFPQWFGSLPRAFSTIFHGVLLGEFWREVYDTMAQVDPYVGFFIYPTIVVLNFLILQMVLGVIINALHFQNLAEDEHKKHSFILGWITGKHKDHHDSPLSADTKIIMHEINRLKIMIDPKTQGPKLRNDDHS